MVDRQKLLQVLPAIERYATTVLAVVCTLTVRLVLDPMLGDRAPYLLFMLTIVVVKRLWGRGPALLATLLGGIATWYFVIQPRFSFTIMDRADALNLTAYFIIGAGISFLGEASGHLPASTSAGMRSIKIRVFRQTVVLAGAAVVLAGMVMLLLHDFARAQDAEGWVVHTYRVINSAESLLSTMKDAETGERGFLLTGDESYLAPYNSAIAALPRDLQKLKDLTSDSSSQQTRWIEINRLTGERMSVLKRAIELRKAAQVDAALDLVRSGEGVQSMNELRSTLDALMDEEHDLLAKRTAEAESRASRGRWVLGLGSGALVLLLVFASVVIERETVRREEITQALRRHADLLEQAHDSLIICRPGGVIGYWNRGAETIYGYTREEAVGRNSHELLQTSHPLGIARIDALLERDGQWKGELTAATKDGRRLSIEAHWTSTVDTQGNKTVLEANRDITERKRAEEALRASESRFRLLFETNVAVVIRNTIDGNIIDCNSPAARMLGYDSPQEMLGLSMRDLHWEPEKRSELMARLQAEKTLFGVEVKFRHKDGRPIWAVSNLCLTTANDTGETFVQGTLVEITAAKRAQEELRRSQDELQSVLASIPDCLWSAETDDQGQVIHHYYSPVVEKITGRPAEFFLPGPERWLSIVHPDDRPQFQESAGRILTGQAGLLTDEYRIILPDGAVRWVRDSVQVRREDGRIRIDGVVSNITERKRAEAERMLLSTAIEQAAETVVITDRDAKIQYVNPAFSRSTGYSRVEALTKNPRVLKSGQHDAEFYQDMWAHITAGQLWHGEFTNRRKDGTLYVEEATIAPVRDASGEITNYIAIKSDITERKIAEEALKRNENLLRESQRVGKIGSYDLDIATGRWSSSAVLDEIFGIGSDYPRDVEGWKAIVHESQREEMGAYFEQIIVERKRFERDYRITRLSDGAVRWVSGKGELVPAGQVPPLKMIGTIQDITERKITEEALEESELRYRQLFERSEGALALHEMVFDAQGKPRDYRFVDVNPAFERYTGLSRSQILGRSALEVLPELEEYWIKLYGRVAATGEPAVFENYARSLGRYYAGSAYSPRPNQFAVSFMDITERKRAEEEVRLLNVELEQRVRSRTAELESANRELEAFAHSVSHDLRAPLRGIDGWSLALLEDCGERLDEQGHKYLDRVRSEAQRMGRLIDDILYLSRVGRGELVPSTVNLTSLTQTIVARLKEANSNRTIEFIVAPQLKGVGDPRLLEIALTNLLANAVKFTGLRALARVEFGKTEYKGKPAFFVRDNGAGFDMAYAGMLFAPFQRLHKTSEFPGTGIGLATVQRVIHRHGGRIWAEAQVGEGATFYFTLGDNQS